MMNQDQEQYQLRESKAPDSVRIAEPAVATSEATQEPSKTAEDMIERVTVRSVATNARPEMEDMISRATPSPADYVIPSDYASDGSQQTGRPRSHRTIRSTPCVSPSPTRMKQDFQTPLPSGGPWTKNPTLPDP